MDLVQELIRGRDNLDQVASRLPCMIHINDVHTFELTYLDPDSQEKLGIPQVEECYAAEHTLGRVHPDDLQQAISSCRHYLAHIEEFSTVSFMQRILLRDGSYLPMFTTSMLMEPLGGLVSFSMDLSGQLINQRSIDKVLADTDYIKTHIMLFGLLRPKEKTFIKYWVEGNSNLQIGERLGLTEQTVKTYKKRIYQKLHMNTQQQLLVFASAFDLI